MRPAVMTGTSTAPLIRRATARPPDPPRGTSSMEGLHERIGFRVREVVGAVAKRRGTVPVSGDADVLGAGLHERSGVLAACSAVIPCFVGWNSRPFRRQPMTKSGPHASRMPSMISRTMRVRFSTFWQPYSSSRLFQSGLTKLSRSTREPRAPRRHRTRPSAAARQPRSASAASRGSPRPSGREGLGTTAWEPASRPRTT